MLLKKNIDTLIWLIFLGRYFHSLMASITGHYIFQKMWPKKGFRVSVSTFGITSTNRPHNKRNVSRMFTGLFLGSDVLWPVGREYVACAIMFQIVKFSRLTVMDADHVIKPQAFKTHMWGSFFLPHFCSTADRCEMIRGEKLQDESGARCRFPFQLLHHPRHPGIPLLACQRRHGSESQRDKTWLRTVTDTCHQFPWLEFQCQTLCNNFKRKQIVIRWRKICEIWTPFCALVVTRRIWVWLQHIVAISEMEAEKVNPSSSVYM